MNQVNEAEMLKFCNRIQQEKDLSKKIYIAGTGRSGLIGKTFAMRLMHCGLNVYVVGETTTPSIENGDILIIISGSGNTDSLVLLANKANKAGASILLISTNKNSQIGEISSLVLTLPATTKNRVLKDTSLATIQPLGSQF
ncbi:SIS domain-containing protein, partial [Ralstonia pickettii]|nr:SIS domain-containing protein [Ralstonia pickettii]